jgi:hypothetical protein
VSWDKILIPRPDDCGKTKVIPQWIASAAIVLHKMEDHHFLKKGCFLSALWLYGRHPSSKIAWFSRFWRRAGDEDFPALCAAPKKECDKRRILFVTIKSKLTLDRIKK